MPGRTVSEIYPSPWLRADDLQGQKALVRVERVDVEALRQRDGNNKEKIVLTFAGKRKRMVLNVTQARAIATIAKTEDIDRWVGMALMLKPGVANNGKPTIIIEGA